MFGEVGDSKIFVNLRRQLDSSTCSLLIWERAADLQTGHGVYHGTDELLIQQNNIPDGGTASPVQERSKRSQSLPLSFSPGRYVSTSWAFYQAYSKITDVVDPLEWLPKCCTARGFRLRPLVLAKRIAELFETLMAILHSLNHPSRWDKFPGIWLGALADETWLWWPIVGIKSQLNVAGRRGISFTYRLNRTGEIIPPWATPARMRRLVDVAVWKNASNVRPFRYEDISITYSKSACL